MGPENESLLHEEEKQQSKASAQKPFLIIGVVALFGVAAVAVFVKNKDIVGSVQLAGRTGELGGHFFDCDYYDDDTIFTEDVCGSFDYDLCYDGSDACKKEYWCNELCGDMCSDGAGAICFFEAVTNIEATCNTVKVKLAELKDTEFAYVEKLMVSKPDEFIGHGLDYGQGDYGCAYHSFCEYCGEKCEDDLVLPYIKDKYGQVDTITLRLAFTNVVSMCTDLGYITK